MHGPCPGPSQRGLDATSRGGAWRVAEESRKPGTALPLAVARGSWHVRQDKIRYDFSLVVTRVSRPLAVVTVATWSLVHHCPCPALPLVSLCSAAARWCLPRNWHVDTCTASAETSLTLRCPHATVVECTR